MINRTMLVLRALLTGLQPKILLRDSPRPVVILEGGYEGYNREFLLDVLRLEWGLTYEFRAEGYTLTLPKGWYTNGHGGRADWVTIFDRQRRPRGQLLQTHATRAPHLYVHCRYRAEPILATDAGDKIAFRVVDEATGDVMLRTGWVDLGAASSVTEDEVRSRLATAYPKHSNPFAYWGDHHESRRIPPTRPEGNSQDPVRALR